ncbi:MAG: cysteine desulfurase family protein [Nitriliruptoraceae bacterium]|jgi:cysteine desulfurase
MRADLDHAATTPPRPEVLEVLARWLPAANASARHLPGQDARAAVEEARERSAAALGCTPADVVFTSGGTEADNLALKGVVWAARAARRAAGDDRPVHVVTSAVEHAAVREALRWLADRGEVELDVVGPRPDGRVAVEDVLDRVRADTGLVSVMGANNETGAVNDVAALGAALRERGVPLHVDSVQCVATLDVDLEAWRADALAVSAHKIGGPQGIGVAVLRRGLDVEPLAHGGGQDRGVRSGTFPVGLIAACGEALAQAAAHRTELRARLRGLSDRLAAGVADLDGVRRTGPEDPAHRLASHVHLELDGVDGDALQLALDAEGVAASSGSACASGAGRGSSVMAAMGRPGTPLRLSLGWTTTGAEVDHAVAVLRAVVPRLRAGGPALAEGLGLRPIATARGAGAPVAPVSGGAA